MEGFDPWLRDMIDAKFVTTRSCNKANDLCYFCIKCAGKTFNEAEKREKHQDHEDDVLKPLKDTHFYGYRKTDIKKLEKKDLLDVSLVQPFEINGKLIYFPKTRTTKYNEEKKKASIGDHGFCYTCGWKLKKPSRYSFCSILCKLSCDPNLKEKLQFMSSIMKRKRIDPTTTLNNEDNVEGKGKCKDKVEENEDKYKDRKEENKENNLESLIVVGSEVVKIKRTRKGIPSRASLL